MKLFLLILLNCFYTLSYAAQTNCKTEEAYTQSDVMYCNEDLGYKITAKYYANVLVGEHLSESEFFKYKEETIRLAADQGLDDRFDYEPSYDEPGTIDLIYPLDGQFEIFKTIIDGKELVFVYWNDIDDNSFSSVFEAPDSYKAVYSIYEN